VTIPHSKWNRNITSAHLCKSAGGGKSGRFCATTKNEGKKKGEKKKPTLTGLRERGLKGIQGGMRFQCDEWIGAAAVGAEKPRNMRAARKDRRVAIRERSKLERAGEFLAERQY